MDASPKNFDVTIQFLVAGLVVHFARIFHVPSSVQKLFKNFMFVSQGPQQARASCTKIQRFKRSNEINRAVLATRRRTPERKTRECRR
jgi:hypothetical protein